MQHDGLPAPSSRAAGRVQKSIKILTGFMAKTICLFSQKGGVGKTSTAVNLAAVLGLARKRTLLVDGDPQGAATAIIGTIPCHPEFNLSDVLLGGVAIEKAIVPSCLHFTRVLAAPSESAGVGRLKLDENNQPLRLKHALDRIRDVFDYIVIDTPTSDWPYITKASSAADVVLLVLSTDYLAFRLLGKSINNIRSIKNRYNPGLKFVGVLLNLYDENDRNSVRVLHAAQTHLAEMLFNTIIPRATNIRTSALLGKPYVVSHFKETATQCYIRLAKELIGRLHRSYNMNRKHSVKNQKEEIENGDGYGA